MTHHHIYTHWPANVEVFRLSAGWHLMSDGIQWIVTRRYKGKGKDRGIAFIGSTKKNLMNALMWNKVPLNVDATKRLDHLPDTFLKWVIKAEKRGLGQKA